MSVVAHGPLVLHFELRIFLYLIPQKCVGSMHLVLVTYLTVLG